MVLMTLANVFCYHAKPVTTNLHERVELIAPQHVAKEGEVPLPALEPGQEPLHRCQQSLDACVRRNKLQYLCYYSLAMQ